jgi:hypothetical protein
MTFSNQGITHRNFWVVRELAFATNISEGHNSERFPANLPISQQMSLAANLGTRFWQAGDAEAQKNPTASPYRRNARHRKAAN